MKRGKRLPLVLGLVSAAALFGIPAAKYGLDRHWSRLYVSGTPDMRLMRRDTGPDRVRELWHMDGFDDGVIPLRASRPRDGGPFPAIVFMYGAGMDIAFTRRFEAPAVQAGFALFVPEQHHQGDRSLGTLSPAGEARAFYRRCFLNGPELRRTLDAVASRPEVDPRRVYVWGASLGALTTARAIAVDARVRRVVFTLAGGDFSRFPESPRLTGAPRRERTLVRVGLRLLSSLDPADHAAGFAPRPFLMQNALRDELIPVPAVEALRRATGGHAELRWYDAAHEEISDADLMDMIRDGLDWLRAP